MLHTIQPKAGTEGVIAQGLSPQSDVSFYPQKCLTSPYFSLAGTGSLANVNGILEQKQIRIYPLGLGKLLLKSNENIVSKVKGMFV